MKGKLVMTLLLALFVGAWSSASAAGAEGKDGYSAVAAGDWHSMAIDEQGRLYTWGSNCFGQLGNGKRTSFNFKTYKTTKNADIYTPTRLDLKPEKRFVHVAAGAMHSLALTDDGMLYAWGNNYYGQLGISTQAIQTKPVPVMDDVRYAAACDRTTVAIKTDGTLWVWGHLSKMMMYGEEDRNTRGSDQYTAVFNIEVTDPRNFSPLQVASGVIKAAAQLDCILYIDEAGQLWGIGKKLYLGVGDEDIQSFETEPVRILPDVVDIAMDERYCYAVDAGGDLYRWGGGRFAPKPGDNDVFLTPTRVMEDVARMLSPKLILKRDDSLWEYGRVSFSLTYYQSNGRLASDGELLYYGNSHRYGSTGMLLDHARSADGRQHFLAMDEDGALYGWGCNIFGQAGTGERTKLKCYHYVEEEMGDMYDISVVEVVDEADPVKLPALMEVKKSTKVTIKDTVPKPVQATAAEPAAVGPGWESFPATLNQKMATRTGPGTKFTDAHGTQAKNLKIVAYAQESGWILVEYQRKDGLLVRTYTGTKRVDADYDAIPTATKEPQRATIAKDSTVYYGPGKAYKDLKDQVKKGTDVLVYGTDMGYAFIEYTVGNAWVRSWISLDSITYQ